MTRITPLTTVLTGGVITAADHNGLVSNDADHETRLVALIAQVAALTGATDTAVTVQPPQSITAAQSSSGTVVVTWQPPYIAQGITGYLLTRTGVDASGATYPPTTLSPQTLTQTFTGLLASGSYTFTVAAVLGTNTSSSVAGSVTLVPAAAASYTPTITGTPTITTTGATASVAYSWTAPTSGTVTGYIPSRTGTDANGAGPFTGAAITALTRTFTNLVPGNTYTLSVQATFSDQTIAAGTASVTVTIPAAVSSGTGTARSWLAGEYGSNGSAAFQTWQSDFGYYPQVLTFFEDFNSAYSQNVSSIASKASSDYLVANSDNNTTRNVITLGLILSAGGANNQAQNPAAMALAAGGDSAYVAGMVSVAQAIKNGGLDHSSTVIRLGHEANGGNWYPWATKASGSYTQAQQTANYVAAWKVCVNAIRTVCSNVQFELCLNCGPGLIADHYAGDAYVDILSVDIYDKNQATTTAQFLSAQGGSGINEVAAFANTHSKKFAIGEWGVSTDNPFFITSIYNALIAVQNQYPGIVDHDSYQNQTTGSIHNIFPNGPYPNASAKYAQLWPVTTAPPAPAASQGAPTGVAATGGLNVASVSFTAPASGQTVSNYTVTAVPSVTTNPTVTATGTTTTIAFDGSAAAHPALVADAYTFTVTATSSLGTSVASASASATVTPMVATGFAAVANGGGQVTVTWTGSSGVPNQYNVFQNFGYKTTVHVGAALQYIATGLTVGTQYSYELVPQINAVNGTQSKIYVTAT